MESTSIIDVIVTQESTNVQVGTDAALGDVTKRIEDLHTKVDDIANKKVEVDLTGVAQESTIQEVKTAIDAIDIPTIDTSAIAQESTSESILTAINSISTTMYKGVPIVAQTTNATIAPNVWNVWGDVTALTITKGAEIEGIVNSYLIRFIAGEGCAITFDGFALKWYGGAVPTWNAGSTYEINIVDNLALWAEFAQQ